MIRSEHVMVSDVSELKPLWLSQIFLIDLNQSFLGTCDQLISEQYMPLEEIQRFLGKSSQSGQKHNPAKPISRFQMIVDILLQQILQRNSLTSSLSVLGISGSELIPLFSKQYSPFSPPQTQSTKHTNPNPSDSTRQLPNQPEEEKDRNEFEEEEQVEEEEEQDEKQQFKKDKSEIADEDHSAIREAIINRSTKEISNIDQVITAFLSESNPAFTIAHKTQQSEQNPSTAATASNNPVPSTNPAMTSSTYAASQNQTAFSAKNEAAALASQQYFEVFIIHEGKDISFEAERKCTALAKTFLRLNTDNPRKVSFRICDFSSTQSSLPAILQLSSKDLICNNIASIQIMSSYQLSYAEGLLNIIQSKKIFKYQQTQRMLAKFHQQHPIKMDELHNQSKICIELSGELPSEENKSEERRSLVKSNLKCLQGINENLLEISSRHPKVSLQQVLQRKKLILRLIHEGKTLEEAKREFQLKAQSLVSDREEIARVFSDFLLVGVKAVTEQKLDMFNSELLVSDVSYNTGLLLDSVRQDLAFTKKIFEICKDINTKVFIQRKNIEKSNQKQLAEFIDEQLLHLQAHQFKTLRNVESSVIRMFISLQQTLDSIGIRNPKINSKRKAVLDELTAIIKANAEYQTYLASGSEGASLGKSFKLLIETYFKDFLK